MTWEDGCGSRKERPPDPRRDGAAALAADHPASLVGGGQRRWRAARPVRAAELPSRVVGGRRRRRRRRRRGVRAGAGGGPRGGGGGVQRRGRRQQRVGESHVRKGRTGAGCAWPGGRVSALPRGGRDRGRPERRREDAPPRGGGDGGQCSSSRRPGRADVVPLVLM